MFIVFICVSFICRPGVSLLFPSHTWGMRKSAQKPVSRLSGTMAAISPQSFWKEQHWCLCSWLLLFQHSPLPPSLTFTWLSHFLLFFRTSRPRDPLLVWGEETRIFLKIRASNDKASLKLLLFQLCYKETMRAGLTTALSRRKKKGKTISWRKLSTHNYYFLNKK